MDQINPFRLMESAVAQGYRLFLHDEIGSTNDEAMRLARSGDGGRAWVVAEAQLKGRGRRGRQWLSPPGNLYASLLLIDEVPMQHAPQLGFVAGVALARALRECLGHDEGLRLKWPNDILFDGAKLAGILLESTVLPSNRFACIVGIGVNCASCPSDLAYPTAALGQIGALQHAAQDVLFHLSRELPNELDVFSGGKGFEAIRADWLSFAAGVGAPMRVETATGTIEGLFRTIDMSGRLILDGHDGTNVIESGDVWLTEPAAGSMQ